MLVHLVQLKNKLNSVNENGDTIVEVLICMVLIAFILTGAYITANNSFLNIRESQERIVALGIAQGQIEALRAEATTVQSAGPSYVVASGTGTPFCFLNDNSGNLVSTSFSVSTRNPSCTSNSIYHYAIICNGKTLFSQQTPANTNATYNFEVIVTWQGLSDNDINTGTADNSKLALFYRTEV